MKSGQGMYPWSSFLEAWAKGVEVAAADQILRFSNLQGFSEGGQNRDGWVDVRGCSNLVILANPIDEAATITVQSLRTIMDTPANLVAPASQAATGLKTIYDDTVSGVAYIRILYKYTSDPDGTLDVSIFAE